MGNKQTSLYNFGGDEFIFVEFSEEMSLEMNFKTVAVTNVVKSRNISGIVDVCPANASYMVRFNPDMINGYELIEELKEIESNISDFADSRFDTRLIEIPILFEDPWTHETVMRFRDRHQDPSLTDLEFASKVNGYSSKESFIQAITDSPFLVSMVGFVPGFPFCFQLVPQDEQIEVPKYLRPRTYTPERCFSFGGGFAGIYPADGTGGAQMLGRTPNPVFNREQNLFDFKESMVFLKQGDIIKFRSIDRAEYDAIRAEVTNGTFKYVKKGFSFTPKNVLSDLKAFATLVNRTLQKQNS